nr:hypothetical protein [Tanacetum cinerariifolium]
MEQFTRILFNVGGNNVEASGSASRQAQQTEPTVGQDGSGGSGVGAVIGLFAAVGECGAGGPGGAGVASQGSSHSRWTKRIVQTERISPQKRTPTQPTSQSSTSSQVPVTETMNADGREMSDGVPTRSSATCGASEWSFLDGRLATASRGGRTGERAGRGDGRTRGHSCGQGDGRNDGPDGLVGGQGSAVNGGDQSRGQWDGRNQNSDAINDHIRGDVRNANEGNNRRGCTHKEFLACNPKEYDGKGGVIVYTRWIKKMESVHDMSGCRNSQGVKYTGGLFVGKALTWWNFEIHTRGREADVGMSWEDFRTLTREEFLRCKSWKLSCGITPWSELAMLRILIGFMSWLATEPKTIQKAVQLAGTLTDEAFRNGSIKNNPKKRGNWENLAHRPGGYQQNQVLAVNGGQYRGNQARGREFMLGAEEARQDPNIMTGTFTLKNHYATTLLDSGDDYSFVSTTFLPLLDIEPSDLGFSYEIEIASGHLVEINKVIMGCKLEIEGHMFDINLTPFVSGSFDVIIGMDWLSNHRAEIICHEKVVRIPLLDGKVLRVLEDKPKEKMRQFISVKAKEKEKEEIVVVRDFPEVFSMDLSGLPSVWKIKFRIELIPGATPVEKSLYRLEPFELEELRVINGDGIHVDPSKIEAVKNWEAPRIPSEVCSFLGLVRYYRILIENFSKIAKPFIVLAQKSKTFDWGEERENAFQTLKDKLCNAPVLALPDRPKDFIVYCNALGLGLGYVLMQRNKVISYASKQLKIHEKNYTTHDLELDAVMFALKIRRHYLYRTNSVIYTDHKSKGNVVADALSRKKRVKPKRVVAMNMTLQSSIKDRILAAQKEAFVESAGLQSGIDEMIELRNDGANRYWWPGMKEDIVVYLRITMDFVTKFPRTSSGDDAIWVIVDRLTNSAHFLSMREDYKMDRLARLYLNKIVARHGTDDQSESKIQTLEDMLRACNLDLGGSWDVHLPIVEFSYNNSYHSSVRCAPFEALLKAARDRQKSYADKRRKPRFSICDHVLLKVSPWKGVVRFGKKGKLTPRFVRPFENIEKVGIVAYRLDLLEELNGVHDTFHLSNLMKCLADPTMQVPLDEIRVDDKLNFVEEHVEIGKNPKQHTKPPRVVPPFKAAL